MTINARKQGKWRRGLTAVGAAGALLLSGIALAPTVAAEKIKEPASFKIESKNGNNMVEKCDIKAGDPQYSHPIVEGTKPPGWTGYPDLHSFMATGKDTGVITCNGYVEVEVPSGCPEGQVPVNGVCENEQPVCPEGQEIVNGKCVDPNTEGCPEGQVQAEDGSCVTPDPPCEPDETLVNGVCQEIDKIEDVVQDVQQFTPPPPCWSAEGGNNCPVGGALRFASPNYGVVGVPTTMYAYASWRPDENSPGGPTNGSAVIRVNGEDYSGVEFVDGVAQWRFIPETPGTKTFTASGVVFSATGGGSAYIDTVPGTVEVIAYDPLAFAMALKKKRVEVGDKYTIVNKDQAKTALGKRVEWSVSPKSEDVCAVYETKRGKVKAKFTDSGKCTVIWADPKSAEEGKYTFIAKK